MSSTCSTMGCTRHLVAKISLLLESCGDRQLQQIVTLSENEKKKIVRARDVRTHLEGRMAAGDKYALCGGLECPTFHPMHGCQCSKPENERVR